MSQSTYIRDGFVSAGNAQITGSLGVTGGITGSLKGTASYSTQALSASYAPSAVAAAFPFTGSAIISSSLTVIGSTSVTGSVNVIRTTIGSCGIFENNSYNLGGGPPILVKDGLNSLGLGYGSATAYFYTPASGLYIHGYGSFGTYFETGNVVIPNKLQVGSSNLTTGAKIHIAAGTATALTAPIKLTTGTNLTTPEAGAIEFDGNSLFFTTGSTRSTILTNINPASITGSIRIAQTGTVANGSNSTFIGTEGVVIGKGKVPTLENIFIGSGSINTSITTGTQNYCFGVGSGNGITSGIYNVLMGPNAGASINSGQSNVFIGRTPGYRTTTGLNNIALGNTTLYYNTTTSDNIAIGTSALQGSNANTGARNIGIGTEAGYAILTGNNNVYVGYRAGRFISDGVTDALVVSASIFIGAETRPLSSSQTNQIVIGHEAIGLGSNTVVIGNNSITTTSLKGVVQVSGSLDVSGSTTIRGNTTITGSLLVSGSVRLNGNAGVNITGNTQITGSLLVSGSSLVAGITPIPLAGTIQDGVTSVLGSLNDWNSNFYQGTVLYSEIAGGTITFGQLCYRTNTGTWALADATGPSAASSTSMLGICVKSSTSTNPTSILVSGFVEVTSYAAILKTGEPLYMSITPGSMSKSAPTASGNVVRIIGNTFWDSNTNAKIILYFNPDRTWIELT